MNLNLLTLGSDPEQMLFDRRKGKIVSAIPVLKVDKNTPVDLGDGFKTYADNVMIESNVPPAKTKDEFRENFRDLFNRIAKKIGVNYEVRNVASHDFTEKECDHEWARIAGCNPEMCAYELAFCYPPDFVGGFRSAGGHIHLGRSDYKEHLDNAENVPMIDPYNKADIIKLMDIFVGSTMTLIDKDPTSFARKTLYGKAGRHRPTEYGVEYRTPGNFWLNSPRFVDLVYDLSAYVIKVNADSELREAIISAVPQELIEKAVNENDRKAARGCQTLGGLPADLSARVDELAEMTDAEALRPLAEAWEIKA